MGETSIERTHVFEDRLDGTQVCVSCGFTYIETERGIRILVLGADDDEEAD